MRAYEAAVRRRSLTAAARELSVTPGAISRHVALLEKHFDCQLLVREQRGVRPTEVGETYFKAVGRALDEIDAASRALASRAAPANLVVQLYTALVVDWVAPRIERFHRANPGIEVKLIASVQASDASPPGVDLAGVLETSDLTGMHQDLLLKGRFAPVCAPELLAHGPPLRNPEGLYDYRRLTAAPEADFWRRWFAAAGVAAPLRGSSQLFESASLADQAARRSAGFAMGNVVLLADDLAAGRLVAPFPQTIEPLPPYCLACHRHRADEPAIAAFRKWLVGEMREHLARHASLLAGFTSLGASPTRY